MSGPPDQARFSQLNNYGVLRRAGLPGVGGDDFKILPRAERQKRVLGAAPRMDAAKHRANARALLDEGDAAVKIVAAKKDVIKQCRHLIRGPTECWPSKSASGEAEKGPARNKSQHWRLHLRG